MTMPRHSENDGETSRLWRQCVALAGALAEEGVGTVDLLAPSGSRRTLASLVTDLPGVLEAAPEGSVLRVESIGLEVQRASGALRSLAAASDAANRICRAVDAAARPSG